MTKDLESFMDLTAVYLRNMKADGQSENTLNNYSASLSSFISYLEESGDRPNLVGIMNWKASLSDSGNKISTIGQRMTDLYAFFNWAVSSGFLDENPITKSIIPRKPKRKPYANLLTEEQFKRLLAEEKPKTCWATTWPRNRAIVILFLTTALRNSELRLLTPGDMDDASGHILVRNGKGDKYRVVDYPPIAQTAIRQYLASGFRPAHLTDDDYLFGYMKKDKQDSSKVEEWSPFDRTALSQMIERHVANVTGRKDIRSHALRHACASVLISSGMASKELQALLGHASLSTTEIYAELIKPNTAPARSANRIFKEMEYQTRRGEAELKRLQAEQTELFLPS